MIESKAKAAVAQAIIFAVYGTLKQGHPNHRYLDRPGVEFLGLMTTEPKFTMVSLGGFPAVHCEGDTTIQLELYKTSDPAVIRSVYGLEGYSGTPTKEGGYNTFYDVEYIETPFGTASMFVFRGPIQYRKVVSGDWTHQEYYR